MHFFIYLIARLISNSVEEGSRRGAFIGAAIGGATGVGIAFIWVGFVPQADLMGCCMIFGIILFLIGLVLGSKFIRA